MEKQKTIQNRFKIKFKFLMRIETNIDVSLKIFEQLNSNYSAL